MKYWFLLFCLLFTKAALAIEQNTIKFISVADIHFDPFAQCLKSVKFCKSFDSLQRAPYQQWEQIFAQSNVKGFSYKDASYAVLRQSLLHMEAVSETEKPAFVIILGDFLSHDFKEDYLRHSKDHSHKSYEIFVRKTFQFIGDEFSKTFPNISIYPVIGNNDSYRGDYFVESNGPFYKDIMHIWKGTLLDKINRESFYSQFPKMGYYEINLSDHSKLIILNSVAFSINAKGRTVKQSADEQLNWLEKRLQLAKTNNEKIILAYHIPVGIDVYATVQNKLNEIIQFWKERYTKKFEELLEKYQVVQIILSGHIHIDSFHAITLKQFAGVPVNITPSISPLFGNEPAFKVISLNRHTLKMDETETYYTPIAKSEHWKLEKSQHKEIHS